MMLRAKSRRTREWLARARAADAAMYDLDPTDMSDAALAQCVAEYFVTRGPPPHRLFILHDVRPSAERNIARARKQFPNYQPADPIGPCPLDYDWTRKNLVGIRGEEDRAVRWIVEAMLLGYAVFRCFGGIRSGGSGWGTLAQIRARHRERAAMAAGDIRCRARS